MSHTSPKTNLGAPTPTFTLELLRSSWNLTLRHLRLSLIAHLTGWKNDKEERKVVMYQSRTAAVSHTLPHLPPLAIAILLIVFNTKGYFIGQVSTTTLTAVQFAAKFLEVMIQASLASMVIGIYRQYMIGTGGVPFGLFIGSYRIADISYLWSLEFWAAAMSRSKKRWRLHILAAILPPAVILAAIVGPSGAVLMLPRSVAVHDSQVLVVIDSQSALFPNEVNLIDGNALQESMLQISELPAGIGSYFITDASTVREMLAINSNGVPLSVSEDVFITTIPSRQTSIALDVLFDFGSGGIGPSGPTALQAYTKQPLIQSFCQYGNNAFPTGSDLASTYIDFGSDNPSLKNLITADEALKSSVSNITFYVRPPPANTQPQHSALVVYGLQQDPSSGYIADFRACTINATWANTLLNTSSSVTTNFLLQQNPTLPVPATSLITLSASLTPNLTSAVASIYANSTNIFNLQPDRLILLALANGAPSAPITNPLRPLPLSSAIANTTVASYHNLTPQQVTSLSTYLTTHPKTLNGYRQSQIYISTTTPWTDPSELTFQPVIAIREGYGYDSSDVTVQLSIAVLGLYSLATIIYITYTTISGLSGTSWDNISEVLMLGLCSNPPPERVGYVSAGVSRAETYREKVSVRVGRQGVQGVEDGVEGEERTRGGCELVFDDEHEQEHDYDNGDREMGLSQQKGERGAGGSGIARVEVNQKY